MKNLLFMLVIVFSAILTSCSSDPIEPKIIGTTFLQKEKGVIFAEFDTVRYIPTIIYTGEKIGRDGLDGRVKPIVGLQVTIFTSNIHQEPVFFAGQVTVEQIEKYYHKDYSFAVSIVIFIILFCICVIGIRIMPENMLLKIK